MGSAGCIDGRRSQGFHRIDDAVRDAAKVTDFADRGSAAVAASSSSSYTLGAAQWPPTSKVACGWYSITSAEATGPSFRPKSRERMWSLYLKKINRPSD